MGFDRLSADIAHELRPKGIAVDSLWPGAAKTDFVLASAAQSGGRMDLSQAESPISPAARWWRSPATIG